MVCTLNQFNSVAERQNQRRRRSRRYNSSSQSATPQDLQGYVMATAPHTLASLSDVSKSVADWVASVRELTLPDRVYWCDGSQVEFARLRGELLAKGELRELNQKTFPDCYLYRSDPSDVARVEHLTFICTKSKEDAGPNNNWMDPVEARAK